MSLKKGSYFHTNMNTSIFTDPKIIGPGIWFKIHIDAVYATTDELKESFIINVNNLCDNFKCKKCQGHFRNFIDTYSLGDYWNISDVKGRDIGFFKWTWELHNQVNKFLHKYQPSLDEAYEYYIDNKVGACFNCGDDDTSPPISLSIPSILTLYRETGVIEPKPFQFISNK